MTSQVFAKLFFLQALSSSPPAFSSPFLKRDQKRETRKQKWVLTSSPGSPPAVSFFLFEGWPSALPFQPGTAVWRPGVPWWHPAPVWSSPERSSAPLSERHMQWTVIAPSFKHKALLASLSSEIDTKESAILEQYTVSGLLCFWLKTNVSNTRNVQISPKSSFKWIVK